MSRVDRKTEAWANALREWQWETGALPPRRTIEVRGHYRTKPERNFSLGPREGCAVCGGYDDGYIHDSIVRLPKKKDPFLTLWNGRRIILDDGRHVCRSCVYRRLTGGKQHTILTAAVSNAPPPEHFPPGPPCKRCGRALSRYASTKKMYCSKKCCLMAHYERKLAQEAASRSTDAKETPSTAVP